MEILENIAFNLDRADLLQQAHLEAGSDEAGELMALADAALRIGKPKAAYAAAFVESRDGDAIRIGGITFRSRMLAVNLRSVERVFPMIATCGLEMDAAAPARGDALQEFWWELIKNRLLDAADEQLRKHVRAKFRLGKTASMQPGSGDETIWPIDQQSGLFALLGDVRAAIGVTLTEFFLMVPNKTMSGILFPVEKDFKSCEVCHRDNCPSRSTAFNLDLWQATMPAK